MGLNIKNESVHALVKELAQRTGKSQVSAVEEAVKNRLAQLDEDRLTTRKAAISRAVSNLQNALTEDDKKTIADSQLSLYNDKGLTE